MTATETTPAPIDIYFLPASILLSTEQVGVLGRFSTSNTLTHNRSVGRPGPRHLKVAGRVWYRVADLLTFLDEQRVETDRQIEARAARFSITSSLNNALQQMGCLSYI